MKRLRLAVVVLVLGMIVAGCGADDGGDEGGPSVVATTTILGDLVRGVGGDDVSVQVLTPVGADPHDFQASASQVAAINEADLVVANGLGLEVGLEDVLDAAIADGVPVFQVGPMLDPIPFVSVVHHDEHEEEGADHEEHEEEGADYEEHEHGDEDPHVWFDPVRMAEAANLIAVELSELDSETDWVVRAEEYAAELLAADEEISETLSSIPDERRLLVTNHGSLGYFADRYDFEVIGVIIPGGSTLGDPSSTELAELVETMQREDVNVIFAETTQPSALADAVAGELGEDVDVVGLYTGSLGEPGSGADTLIEMLQTNAELIADYLSK